MRFDIAKRKGLPVGAVLAIPSDMKPENEPLKAALGMGQVREAVPSITISSEASQQSSKSLDIGSPPFGSLDNAGKMNTKSGIGNKILLCLHGRSLGGRKVLQLNYRFTAGWRGRFK
jgi:hypothetical protein